MPLTMVNAGEPNVIRKVGGKRKPEDSWKIWGLWPAGVVDGGI